MMYVDFKKRKIVADSNSNHLPIFGKVMWYSVPHCGQLTAPLLFPFCFSSSQRCRHDWWIHLVQPLHLQGLTHSALRSSRSVAKHTQQCLEYRLRERIYWYKILKSKKKKKKKRKLGQTILTNLSNRLSMRYIILLWGVGVICDIYWFFPPLALNASQAINACNDCCYGTYFSGCSSTSAILPTVLFWMFSHRHEGAAARF